jgi:nitrate/nitrite sensing protein/HAAS domain-containing protein
MSGTALDHPLVRGYLRELDAALRGLPAAQASELREQITAHLDDALGPDAGDQEVAVTLRRLGSPAGLAAEAGGAGGSSAPPSALGRGRVRWRLAAVIAVLVTVAVVLGALQIGGVASSYVAAGRDQHLARLGAAVVTLTRDLEDERDLSGAYAARGQAGPVPLALARARAATDTAARAVRADAAGIGAGYQPGTVQDLEAVLAALADLGTVRGNVSSRMFPAAQVIRVYSGNIIGPENTFSAALGGGTGDEPLQAAVTTLAALLRVENDQSVQRAILYAALSARPPVLASEDLDLLRQASLQERTDLADFNASTNTAGQELYSNTVAGQRVDVASSSEILALQRAATSPGKPLTSAGLDAVTWYRDKSTTISDTRKVTGQLVGQLSGRADALRSDATRNLLLISITTGVLLLLLLAAAVLARPRYQIRTRVAGSSHSSSSAPTSNAS